MQPQTQQQRTEEWYDRKADEYSAALTLEDIMEATTQATQREITVTSLAVVRTRMPRLHLDNELLVQYLRPGANELVQVVPDNMVVLYDGHLNVERSYAVERQPVGPFWMLEYVSPNNARKDYDDNYLRYIHDLRVPYYLMFDPLAEAGRRYGSIAVLTAKANRSRPMQRGDCRCRKSTWKWRSWMGGCASGIVANRCR